MCTGERTRNKAGQECLGVSQRDIVHKDSDFTVQERSFKTGE